MAYNDILAGLQEGSVVPFLGAGALAGSVHCGTGEPLPAESEALILALNGGKPMAPKLMYEFSRAAMHIEFRRGRPAITRFLDKLYSDPAWSRPPLHDWLAGLQTPYVVDLNRDTHLLTSYADRPHTLIVGVARLGGTEFRYRVYRYDGNTYRETLDYDTDSSGPILFKPMGTPVPEPQFIASDADYVDYITELMGGFAIPPFLKRYRPGRRYLLLGLRLNRDTERMMASEIMFAADRPAGWAVIPDPTRKEKKFCERLGIELLPMTTASFIAELGKEIVA